MTWHVPVLLLLSLATTGTAGSQVASGNLLEEEEVVLLQTRVTSHRRAEEEDNIGGPASIEESEQRATQDSFTRVLHNLMNQGLQSQSGAPTSPPQPHPLRVLPSETLSQAKPMELPWEDASLMAASQEPLDASLLAASQLPPALPSKPGRGAEESYSSLHRDVQSRAAPKANLEKQLQTVANQRDAALTQAEESTEALRVVQEELKLALLTSNKANILYQATTPFPGEDATQPPPTTKATTKVFQPPPKLSQTTIAETTTEEVEVVVVTPKPTHKITTTGEPEEISDALSFNGEVSQVAGIIVWSIFLLVMICCGCMCALFMYGFVTKSVPSLYGSMTSKSAAPGKGGPGGTVARREREFTQIFDPAKNAKGPQRAVPPSLKKEKQGPKNQLSSIFDTCAPGEKGLNLDCC
mmetsp:Transcript_110487/g.195557  ORF Transcript_110487/g.195557 Transcript_110487/m.195557 type:complete len:412 (+) Transcript_110487:118-1353(+)